MDTYYINLQNNQIKTMYAFSTQIANRATNYIQVYNFRHTLTFNFYFVFGPYYSSKILLILIGKSGFSLGSDNYLIISLINQKAQNVFISKRNMAAILSHKVAKNVIVRIVITLNNNIAICSSD